MTIPAPRIADPSHDGPPLAGRRAAGPSLFVLSLPRSLSTLVYHFSRLALRFQPPAWVTDGEILNADRFVFNLAPDRGVVAKYLRPSREPEAAARIRAFLDDAVLPHGAVYKDVVHPFLIADWLAGKPFRVLKIRRNLADVLYSMRRKRWLYPAAACPEVDDPDAAAARGLVRAAAALDAVPGETVDFDRLIESEESLLRALGSLYGDDAVEQSLTYIDDEFRGRRDAILRRRETAEHAALAHLLRRERRAMERAAGSLT